MKKAVTSEEYKKVLIETFDVFDSFCRKNNLKYFMIGGTLLGAVRHKGFIPWDDDIDVGMPRKDYEKFSQIFPKDGKIRFIDCFNNNKYYLPYGKLCNYKIDLHENINSKLHLGAYIDVFPFDYIKENKNYKKYFDPSFSLLGFIRRYKIITTKGKNIIKKIILIFLHIMYPFSLNHIAKIWIKKSDKLKSDVATSKIGNLYGIWFDREIVEYEWFSDVVELEFEKRKYFAPKNYDNYLKRIYGSYMQLPPIEQRVTHHDHDVYWSEQI